MAEVKKRWQVVSGTITRRAEGGNGRGARLGKRYKRGDVFEAPESEVRACRDQIRLLDPSGDGVRREEAPATEPVHEPQNTVKDEQGDTSDEDEPSQDSPVNTNLRIQQAAPGWYDVINDTTGEKVNDKRLRKDEAEALVTGG